MGDSAGRSPTERTSAGTRHIPVLLEETLVGLQIRPGVRSIDGTLGGGGHTAHILEHSDPDGEVLGLDADPEAIERVTARLQDMVLAGRLRLAHAHFAQMQEVVRQQDYGPADAILLDLGVSSFQLETPERGFSFLHEGPLDMRLDPTEEMSAADVVNTFSQTELADLIYHYGEERQSRRIARYIVQRRPFHTTLALAQVIEQAVGGRRGNRLHPATRTFQALRIYVNQELVQLADVLPQSLQLLRPGGRLAVISFHSLEDRIVKQWMQQEARSYVPDPTHSRGGYEREPTVRIITGKPITPDKSEIVENPRSRSAKLRIAERI